MTLLQLFAPPGAAQRHKTVQVDPGSDGEKIWRKRGYLAADEKDAQMPKEASSKEKDEPRGAKR